MSQKVSFNLKESDSGAHVKAALERFATTADYNKAGFIPREQEYAQYRSGITSA